MQIQMDVCSWLCIYAHTCIYNSLQYFAIVYNTLPYRYNTLQYFTILYYKTVHLYIKVGLFIIANNKLFSGRPLLIFIYATDPCMRTDTGTDKVSSSSAHRYTYHGIPLRTHILCTVHMGTDNDRDTDRPTAGRVNRQAGKEASRRPLCRHIANICKPTKSSRI